MPIPLDKEHLEALLRAAKMSARRPVDPKKAVESFRFQPSDSVSSADEKALKEIHGNLAEALSQSLGAYLRANFEAFPGAIKQSTYREQNALIPQRAYVLAFQLQGAPMLVQMNASLVFPLLDILLGGNGQSTSPDRDFTEIEDHVIAGIGKIIGQAVEAGWSADLADCKLLGVQSPMQLQNVLPGTDKVFDLQFEIKLADGSGDMRLIIPATTINTLLRNLGSDPCRTTAPAHPASRKVGEKLLQCMFPATLAVTSIQLPIQAVLSMQAGQICNLGVPLTQPALLSIANRDTFEAIPVRNGHKRAAHLGEQISPLKRGPKANDHA